MKLYTHPASTTCRAVMHFAAEEKIALDMQVVDIFTGEHYGDAYTKVNPSRLIPTLDDGGFVLTESAAILRYLAEKTKSPAYPADPRQRARVNEAIDWFNSNFYRDWGYGLIYPQLFPHLKREDPAVQAATVAWGREKSKVWLKVLNDHFLGPKNKYLHGEALTIADYFGFALTTAGQLIHCDFTPYANVTRWLGTMRKTASYASTYEVFNGFVASTKDKPFDRI
jgi:glutathione S-transferase